MKKSELIDAIQQANPKLLKSEIQRVIDATCAAAQDTIQNGRDFAIPGLVAIEIVDRAEREGRNPATGAPITIPARRSVKARIAGPIKASVPQAK